jgi:hypothetical protein
VVMAATELECGRCTKISKVQLLRICYGMYEGGDHGHHTRRRRSVSKSLTAFIKECSLRFFARSAYSHFPVCSLFWMLDER